MRRPGGACSRRSALRHEVAQRKEKIARLAPGALSITSVECSLVWMLRGKGHVGEHVMLDLVHQLAEFLELGPQLIGDACRQTARRLAVGLDEGLADGGGRQPSPASLARRPAALRMKCTRQRCHVPPTTRWTAAFSPSCASGDHELDAAQAASGQALQEVRPEGLGFRRADAEPDDLGAALRCWRPQRLSRRPRRCVRPRAPSDRSHPATDRPIALERTFQEGLHGARRFPCTVSRPGSSRCRKVPSLARSRRPGASTPRRSRPPG